MKIIGTIITAAVFALTLTACGGDDDGSSASTGSSNTGSGNTSTGGSNTSSGNTSAGGNTGSSGTVGGQTTTYTVTPSVNGSGGTISPSSTVLVQLGATTSFTLKPDAGYTASVSGTCGGTLDSSNVYTTQAVTANCTVVAAFATTGNNSGSNSASAADCYNANDFVAGTIVEYDLISTDTPLDTQISVQHTVITTEPRETFAGLNLIPRHTLTTNDDGYSSTPPQKSYYDIVNGSVLFYGTVLEDGMVTTIDPPLASPIDGQPGDVRTFDYKTAATGGTVPYDKVITSLHEINTYVGQETLQTPLGTFKACKFIKEVTSNGTSSSQQTWIAAEGPYRGQLLKDYMDYGSAGTTSIVTNMTYTPAQ